MVWVFASVVFGALVLLLVGVPASRKPIGLIALGLAALVVLGGAWLFWADKRSSEEFAKKAALERAAIPMNKVEVANAALESNSIFVSFTGLLRNNSTHHLRDAHVTVRIEECQAAKCEITSEDKLTFGVAVPPQQARHFDAVTDLKVPASGDWRWSYEVTETVADLDASN